MVETWGCISLLVGDFGQGVIKLYASCFVIYDGLFAGEGDCDRVFFSHGCGGVEPWSNGEGRKVVCELCVIFSGYI